MWMWSSLYQLWERSLESSWSSVIRLLIPEQEIFLCASNATVNWKYISEYLKYVLFDLIFLLFCFVNHYTFLTPLSYLNINFHEIAEFERETMLTFQPICNALANDKTNKRIMQMDGSRYKSGAVYMRRLARFNRLTCKAKSSVS